MSTPKPKSLATTLLETVAGKLVPSVQAVIPAVKFRTLVTGDDWPKGLLVLLEALNSIERAFTAVQTLPEIGGVYLPDVVFAATTDLAITHGLLQGTMAYAVTRVRAAGGVYPVFVESGTQTIGVLTLRASAACTADVRVYQRPTR